MATEPPDQEPLSIEEEELPEMILPVEDEAVELTESASAEAPVRKIQAFGSGPQHGSGPNRQFKRPLNLTGAGATRCKTFHCKIAVSSMEYMESQINEWLDSHEVEAKCVTQVVGVMEGKTAEPNLIVMIWY